MLLDIYDDVNLLIIIQDSPMKSIMMMVIIIEILILRVDRLYSGIAAAERARAREFWFCRLFGGNYIQQSNLENIVLMLDMCK